MKEWSLLCPGTDEDLPILLVCFVSPVPFIEVKLSFYISYCSNFRKLYQENREEQRSHILCEKQFC